MSRFTIVGTITKKIPTTTKEIIKNGAPCTVQLYDIIVSCRGKGSSTERENIYVKCEDNVQIGYCEPDEEAEIFGRVTTPVGGLSTVAASFVRIIKYPGKQSQNQNAGKTNDLYVSYPVEPWVGSKVTPKMVRVFESYFKNKLTPGASPTKKIPTSEVLDACEKAGMKRKVAQSAYFNLTSDRFVSAVKDNPGSKFNEYSITPAAWSYLDACGKNESLDD